MAISTASIERVVQGRPWPATHQRGINNLAFDRTGQLVATGDVEMHVELFRGGELLWSKWVGSRQDKIRPTQRLRSLRMSHDGSRVFVAAADKVLCLSAEDGSLLWDYCPPRWFGFLIVSPHSLAVSEQGIVAAGIDNAQVVTWTEDGQKLRLWKDSDFHRQLAFLPGGAELLGCDSFSLGVFDIETGRKVRRFRLEERAYSMDVAANEPIAVIRTLYDLVVMECMYGDVLLRTPVRPGLPLAAIHPTRELVATTDGFAVKLMDFEGYTLEQISVQPAAPISIAFEPNGQSLVIGCSDHEVRIVELGA